PSTRRRRRAQRRDRAVRSRPPPPRAQRARQELSPSFRTPARLRRRDYPVKVGFAPAARRGPAPRSTRLLRSPSPRFASWRAGKSAARARSRARRPPPGSVDSAPTSVLRARLPSRQRLPVAEIDRGYARRNADDRTTKDPVANRS